MCAFTLLPFNPEAKPQTAAAPPPPPAPRAPSAPIRPTHTWLVYHQHRHLAAVCLGHVRGGRNSLCEGSRIFDFRDVVQLGVRDSLPPLLVGSR